MKKYIIHEGKIISIKGLSLSDLKDILKPIIMKQLKGFNIDITDIPGGKTHNVLIMNLNHLLANSMVNDVYNNIFDKDYYIIHVCYDNKISFVDLGLKSFIEGGINPRFKCLRGNKE